MTTDASVGTIFQRGIAWHSYRGLENDFIDLLNYVSLDERNKETWSEKIAQQLQLTVNIVGSVFHEIGKSLVLPESEAVLALKAKDTPSIVDFRNAFEPIYILSSAEVKAHYGLTYYGLIRPFKNFSCDASPQWWTEQNVVKHRFYEDMTKATLDNLTNALGGLFLLNILHVDSRRYLFDAGVITMEHFGPKSLRDYPFRQRSFIGVHKDLKRDRLGLSVKATSRIFEHIFRDDL
jgi:hypothetical protein